MSDPPLAESVERRSEPRPRRTRLADLTLPELRRIAVTALLFAVVLALFLWMVRAVVIAAILGVVIAVYLRPLFEALRARVGNERVAAVLTLTTAIVPFLGVVVYSYVEVLRVARYLTRDQGRVTAEIIRAARRLPWGDGESVGRTVHRGVTAAARYATDIPEMVAESASGFSVAAAILLFTAFYLLTRRERVRRYVRGHIPLRYSPLVSKLEENVQGVLYGAVYATFVSQALKTAVLFVLFLLFGVPLAALLALVSFIIGFFPVVGSWTVYLPVAVWLVVFRDDLLGAVVLMAAGVFVNTLFISFYLRPKLAAEKSEVLDFYWMFVGLVTGVYTFGLAGLLLGPILIGLLKAILDTVAAGASWRLVEPEEAADQR